MSPLQTEIIDHLAALVAHDTQNPPRRIDTNGIFATLQDRLPGFVSTVADAGAGRVSLLATRGTTDTVFNIHIDTVPATPAWSGDPLRLRTAHDRVVGLGACDIKGAAACLLTAANHTTGPLALLFSSDEEAGDNACIDAFLATDHGFSKAIVAEPTRNTAVLAHRGYTAAVARFNGVAGHGSEQRAMDDSAVHRAIRWSAELLRYAETHAGDTFAGMRGVRLNIGRVNGGIKPNMIAESAEVRFGCRPLPLHSSEALVAELRGLIPADRLEHWETTFAGPPLPANDIERSLVHAQDLAQTLGLAVGKPVNFWSEAALFSRAGLVAFVYGPGNIAQAHTADEWVAIDQLIEAAENYIRIIGS